VIRDDNIIKHIFEIRGAALRCIFETPETVVLIERFSLGIYSAHMPPQTVAIAFGEAVPTFKTKPDLLIARSSLASSAKKRRGVDAQGS
jgi:hypothetical protein